jgi:hypothetical protein
MLFISLTKRRVVVFAFFYLGVGVGYLLPARLAMAISFSSWGI